MRALSIALVLVALPASAQESAEPEQPEATIAPDEAPPIEVARPAEPLAFQLAAAEWPSSPLAPTNALNPRVDRSMDFGFVVTGAALGGLSYLPKASGVGMLDPHTCADTSIALTMIPFLGGPIGFLHGFACRGTSPERTWERTIYGDPRGGWVLLSYAVGAVADIVGLAFLIAGLVGGEGVVTEPPPEGGVALQFGPGGMTLGAAF